MGAAAVPAIGAQATLGNASCQYNGLTIDPAGNLTISCQNVSETAAHFTVTGPSSMAVNTSGMVVITRSGGPAADLQLSYVIGGTCTPGTGMLNFPLGSVGQPVTVVAGAAAGNCTISVTPPTGHTVSPVSGTFSIAVGTGGGGGEQPIPGCPAPAADYKLVDMGWTSAPVELRMTSGTIASFPIPAPPRKASVRLTQGQQALSPGNGTTEFSISKCKGVIDTSNQYCYKSSQASNLIVAPDAYTRPVSNLTSQAAVGSRGCWAPSSEGQWYVNVRWSYNTPGGMCFGYTCGYSMQWFEGSY